MQVDYPAQDEVIAFMTKLGEFRETLLPHEQELLDRMTAALLTSEAQEPMSSAVGKLESLDADAPPTASKTYYAQVVHILKGSPT